MDNSLKRKFKTLDEYIFASPEKGFRYYFWQKTDLICFISG
jgi:hypothetical protein